RYFLSLALQAAPEFRGPDSTSWQVRLAAEHDNLRAALAWALEHDPNRALHVAVQLEKYWFTRGSFTEWDYWLSAALERSTDEDPRDRARALHQIAFTALNRDDLERSRAATEESLRIAQALDMQEALGRAKTNLAYLEERRGDLRAASALAHEALGH